MTRDAQRLRARLERDGILLVHDKTLPCATSIIAGEPVAGSWWSHPMANAIFEAMQPLEEIAVLVKLIGEKETFVHERLWPELVSVGAARARWQEEGLTPNGRELLASISRARHAKPAKELAPDMESKTRAKTVRLLEVRLLAHSDERHTETGAHAKFLQTWRAFARERDINRRPGPVRAREAFEAIVREWSMPGSRPLLPWPS
jgi:hypothetical protein